MFTHDELLSDIPLDLATRAHYWTSHTPEVRGPQEREGYANQLMADYAAVMANATTDEQREQLESAFSDYRQRMKTMKIASLQARTNIASAAITGPSNFPTARNRKRTATYEKRVAEMVEYRHKTVSRMRKLTAAIEDQPIRTGEADAVQRLRDKIAALQARQAQMIAANAAIRKNAKKGAEVTTAALVALGLSTAQAAELLKPNFLGDIGYPAFELRNNNAQIKQAEQQLIKAQTLASATTAEFKYGEITVLDNVEADRVQIRFPGKPEQTTREQLKARGFKWAPSQDAWQRFRGDAALQIAKQLAASFAQNI